jgi:hypothetical protein
MKLFGEMLLACKPLDEDELVLYVFMGLGRKYNSVVSAFFAR